MAARQLPSQPNLSFLKNEAKRLHRAVADGDADAIQSVRPHLRRLAALDDAAVSSAHVTLQETQHALAREYGYTEWPALTAAVDESVLDDLSSLEGLTLRDAEMFLRDADTSDLVTVLQGAPASTVSYLLQAVSPRTARLIRDEMEMRRRAAPEQVVEARRRVQNNLRSLSGQGLITWPPDAGAAADAPDAIEWSPRCQQLVRTPVTHLEADDIADMLEEITRNARKHRLLDCEDLATVAHEFLGEGLRLAIDGFEPDLLEDLLLTRMWALQRRHREMLLLSLEAMASVHSGDNPRVVAYKLETFYREHMAIGETNRMGPDVFADAQIDRLRDVLQKGQFYEQNPEQMREFFVAASIIGRREGIKVVEAIAPLADHPLMQHLLIWPADFPAWIKQAEALVDEAVATNCHRQKMATAGLTALQSGGSPAEVAAAVRAVERPVASEIFGGV